MIRRKPVPGRHPLDDQQKQVPNQLLDEKGAPQDSKSYSCGLDQVDSIQEGQIIAEIDEQLKDLQRKSEPVKSDAVLGALDESAEPATGSQTPSKVRAALVTAFAETLYRAGGLVSHPYEAVEHYSVLRHSIAVVYYHGPTTSLAITVFSDQPLPPNRTLWLQKRGVSGKLGMYVSTLRSRAGWIDVTPKISASPDDLPRADERAWQRDINKFLKKAKDAKYIRNHRPYEPDVVRIPHLADDGYFRITLCDETGKILCYSPVFRIASTSTSPGKLRGASLTSLPVELAIKIGAIVVNNTAKAAVSGLFQPVISAVQNAVQPYEYGGLTQMAATSAYDSSGAPQKLDNVNEAYEQKRELSQQLALGDLNEKMDLVGSDDGPQHPFPVAFSGKIVVGTGKSKKELGVPTANLEGVSENTVLRLSGIYIAWAKIQVQKKLVPDMAINDISDIWYPAVVTVAPMAGAQACVIEKRSVSAYLIYEFDETTFFDVKLKVMIMGFLRPVSQMNAEDQILQAAKDVAITQASLERPAWQAESVLERIKTESSSRSLTKRLADARSAGQCQVDKIPLHRLGIRTASMRSKDQLLGLGGICVKR